MERLDVDVVIVGAGPAGLAAAIRLKQRNPNLDILVLEKGRSVGNHILSGAVINPQALDVLLPKWRDEYEAVTPVSEERLYYTTRKRAWSLPHFPGASQKGGVVISLSQLTRYLAQQAEQLGVSILSGYVGDRVLLDQARVVGIQTGAKGVDEQGGADDPGVMIHAKHTMVAEGARGLLSRWLIDHYQLANQPQTYGLGVKEVWQVDPEVFQPGLVIHALGWPVPSDAYGGGFIYHGLDHRVMVGMIVGLDAPNPTMNPFSYLQAFKHHPKWRHYFLNGKPVAYGARVINEGGYQSIPKCEFPGGVLIGCAGGFVNIAKIKGVHAAIYSGIEAAEAYLKKESFDENFKQHPVVLDLYRCRNVRPWFQYGRFIGIMGSGMDQFLFRGLIPYTLTHQPDHLSIKQKGFKVEPVHQPDGKISFDLLTLLQYSNTHHREGQVPHITLKKPDIAVDINQEIYTYFCPANVYEIPEGMNHLQINSSNCIHCKACTIRDPAQNIKWVHPEGGGGPNYTET